MENHINEDELEALVKRAEQGVKPKAPQETEKCDRITAIFQMIHESCGFDPVKAHTTFTERLKTKDQPYQRRMLIGKEPVTLSADWVKDPGYLIIENKKGGSKTTIKVGVANISTMFEIAPGHIFAVRLGFNALRHLSLWAPEDCPALITVMPS